MGRKLLFKDINVENAVRIFLHVAAYKSIRRNLPLLFTYKNHKELSTPNTTNLIEGGLFSPLKILIKIHRDLNKSLKLKIVDDYLINYRKK
jgi:hypothetical protein